MVKPKSSSSCEARWATPRRPERPTFGHQIIRTARLLGTPLMPWQEQVALVGGELVEGERGLVPAYRTVRFTVPRQNGKTTLVLSWEVQRAHWDGSPQRIAYTAQTGKDARDKLIDDQFPILEARKRELGIKNLRRAIGSEGVLWSNGSQLVVVGGTESGGHGKTLHLGVKDELFKDFDQRRDQALRPGMNTVADAQMLETSTAGTSDSVVWNAAVAQGRAAVESGRDTGVAYFEWSAELESDPGDPATWWSTMPALGRTIGLPAVQAAYDEMPIGEFRRAYCNIPTSAGEQVIPKAAWDLVCSPDVEATAECFAVDMNPERSAGAIVAVGAGPIVEVVDYRAGTTWMIDRCVDLAHRYNCPIVLDPTGPAGSIAASVASYDVKVIEVAGRDAQKACGRFYDLVVNEQVKVRRHEELDAAVAGAAKRISGDVWSWGRKSSKVDISLLVAATVGVWHVAQPEVEQVVELYV